MQTAEPILKLHPRCLTFYVDESGHEDFSDSHYPVYVLGGCAILASDLRRIVREPWRDMKARHFGGADRPLHASDLRNPTSEQLEGLSTYFRTQGFGRFAVVMTNKTTLPPGTKPIELMPDLLRKRYENSRCAWPPNPKRSRSFTRRPIAATLSSKNILAPPRLPSMVSKSRYINY